jgi:hypothetical protein
VYQEIWHSFFKYKKLHYLLATAAVLPDGRNFGQKAKKGPGKN